MYLFQYVRLKYNSINCGWRISSANENFGICESYPRVLVVPSSISDEALQNVKNFRATRRIPVVVWR